MKTGWGLTAATACLLCFSGCADSESLQFAGIARDSAGVRLIELTANAGADRLEVLPIDESWHPCRDMEFGTLSDLGIGSGDRLFLLDEMASTVTVLYSSGEVTAVFGRRGEGPGEFDPQGLSELVLTDSSVLVPDLFLQRITEFSFDGNVLGIKPFPYSPVYAVDWRKHPDGGLVFRALEQTGDLILRSFGESLDTLFAFSTFTENPNLLLSPTVFWDITPEGGLVLGRSDQAAIELRPRDTEKPAWVTRWNDHGGDLGTEDRAHLEALLTEQILRDAPTISGDQLAQNLAMIEYPERVPVMAGVLAAPNGDVWIRPAQPVQSMGTGALRVGKADAFGGRDWEVLNSEGFLRARIQLPVGFEPRKFFGGWLYGILEDDVGVQTVARVRAAGN